MKIVYIDIATTGHHLSYLRSLLSATKDEKVVCLPESNVAFSEKNIIQQKLPPFPYKSLQGYLRWIRAVIRIVQIEKPDIVHFLDGDALYRYGGIGFSQLHAKIVVTCHHIHHWGPCAMLFYRQLSQKADILVFHTESLTKRLTEHKITNTAHVEYPCFHTCTQEDPMYARKRFGIPCDHTHVILALGGTRYNKGLDILLAALKKVNEPFYLLIAGKEEAFDAAYIQEHTKSYHERVFTQLKFLKDEEFEASLNACDIVCLPYRKVFDGASGPLGEGVSLEKMILGPAHGSLGALIKEHHLGMTFKSEEIDSLATVLTTALKTNWIPDETYQIYRQSLSPERFQVAYKMLYRSLTE